jgi:diguanylate cyclase (GGDEF)-like protein
MRREDGRPFARESLPWRAAPFAFAMALALALLPLTASDLEPMPTVGAVLLTVAIAASAWFMPWERLPEWLEALPPLAYFAVILLLREVQGGTHTGYAPLVFLPVVWLLLHGTRRQIVVGLGGLVLTLLAPFVTGGAAVGPSDMRTVTLQLAMATVFCFTVLRLVGQVRRQADELERLASTDSLTGLPNRRVWEDALPRELARSTRFGTPLAIALLDLDDFKGHNDEHGHHGGDRLLKEVAALWPGELRESDLLVRYGGEEFALLLLDCGAVDVHGVVEKVRRATPGGLTCSAGVALWDGTESADELTRRADDALYEAKRGGRDRTAVAGRGSRPGPPGT